MLERNKIHQMNCFDFLEQIENKSVQLAVIDPPYNLNKADWDSFASHCDFLEFTYRWIDKVLDKLDNNGSIYLTLP